MSEKRPNFNMTTFSGEYIKTAYELDSILHGQVWKSRDLALGQDINIKPGSTREIEVSFPKEIFPSGITPKLIPLLKTSVRSRFAQIGLDVPSPLSEVTYQESSDTIKGKIFVRSFSPRPIKIDSDTPIFRFFGLPSFDNPPLRGFSLAQIVSKSGITISGQEGENWQFHYSDTGVLLGIDFKLNPEKEKTIKKTFLSRPIYLPYIPENVTDSRRFIDLNFLTPKKDNSDFKVGETSSRLSINDANINGVISPQCFKDNQPISGVIHLSSVLIDGGFNDYIRTETSNISNETQPGTSIFVQFYQDKK